MRNMINANAILLLLSTRNKKVQQEVVVSEEIANGCKSLRAPELPPGILPVV